VMFPRKWHFSERDVRIFANCNKINLVYNARKKTTNEAGYFIYFIFILGLFNLTFYNLHAFWLHFYIFYMYFRAIWPNLT
jgi:hypothetical protein